MLLVFWSCNSKDSTSSSNEQIGRVNDKGVEKEEDVSILDDEKNKKNVENFFQKKIINNNKNKEFSFKKFSLDSLREVCKINTVTNFNMDELQTDNFKSMTPILKVLFSNFFFRRKGLFGKFIFHLFIPFK